MLNKTSLLAVMLVMLITVNVSAQVTINEFQSSNTKTIKDPQYGAYADWIELYNAGTDTVKIGGYGITDNLSNPTKYILPQGTKINPKGFLIIWADSKATGLHTSFALSKDGEEIGLFDTTGVIVDTLTFTVQASDISTGRYPDGSTVFMAMNNPTPGYKNDSTSLTPVLPKPTLSLPGGSFTNSQTLVLSSDVPDVQIRYTLDGTVPDTLAFLYSAPLTLDTTVVVRAAAFKPGHLPSKIVSATYIINFSSVLPIVSLITDPRNFFSDTSGIYVIGTNGVAGYCSTAPRNWNQEWERPLLFQFFDTTNTVQFEADCSVQIFGGCTRLYDQKSLALYSREEYGVSKFNYKFFKDRETTEFNNLVLRSSGQDWWRTMFRDAFIQTMLRNGMTMLDYQAYTPTVAFLNGRYWGIHNMREKLNEHYLETYYGVDPQTVTILEGNASVSQGSNAEYKKDVSGYLETHSLSDSANYAYIQTKIDVPYYTEYVIAQMYISNADWPGGNIKFWKDNAPGAKWRWLIYDTDFGFWGNSRGVASYDMVNHMTATTNLIEKNPLWSTLIFRKLTENVVWKNFFIQRMAAHMNTTFETNRVVALIDSMKQNIAPEMPRHKIRWTKSASYPTSWDSLVNQMVAFARLRPSYMRSHMQNKFGLTGSARLRLATNYGGRGRVEIAGLDMPLDAKELIFFKDTPLPVKAIPNQGYKFVRWSGKSQSSSDSIVTVLNGEAALTAIFAPQDSILVDNETPPVVHDFALGQNYPNPFNPTTEITFSLPATGLTILTVYNTLGEEVQTIVNAELTAGSHTYQFNASNINSGVYFYRLTQGEHTTVKKMVLVK